MNQREQAQAILDHTVAQVIASVHECPHGLPSGPLYMQLQSLLGISYEGYLTFLQLVVSTGKVKVQNHKLVACGTLQGVN